MDPKSGLLKLRCTKGRNLKHPDISQSDLVDSGVRGIWTLKCNETTGMANNAISFTCFLLIRNYFIFAMNFTKLPVAAFGTREEHGQVLLGFV